MAAELVRLMYKFTEGVMRTISVKLNSEMQKADEEVKAFMKKKKINMYNRQTEWEVHYRLDSMDNEEKTIFVLAKTANDAIAGLRDTWFPDNKLLVLSILPKAKNNK